MADIKPGGLSETRKAEHNIQKLCDEQKPAVEKKIGKNFEMFTAISYRQQVVSGMNYFIKVNVGDNNTCTHIRVYEMLPCHGGGRELHGVLHPRTLEDPIKYFEPNSP